jgi:hypothetical protein
VVIRVTYYKYPSLVRKVPATEHSSNDFLLRFASNIHFGTLSCKVLARFMLEHSFGDPF